LNTRFAFCGWRAALVAGLALVFAVRADTEVQDRQVVFTESEDEGVLTGAGRVSDSSAARQQAPGGAVPEDITGEPKRRASYNLRLGSMEIDLSSRASVIYQDNANAASDNDAKEEATYGELGLNIAAFWPVRPEFQLNLQGYLGYRFVLSGNGTESVIAEASESGTLGADMRIGDNGILSLVDTLSISADTIEFSEEENTADLRMLNNELALQYQVEPSPQLSLSARVGRKDDISLDAKFDYRDMHTYYLSGAADWRLNRRMSVGTYGSLRAHRHKRPQNNDADEFEVGLRWQEALSDVLNLYMSGAYQGVDMDTSNSPTITGQSSGFTGTAKVEWDVTRHFSHWLQTVYYRRLGTSPDVNLTEDLKSSYGFYWTFVKNWYLSYMLAHLRSHEVANDGETSNTWVNNVRIGYSLEHASIYAGYRRTDRASDMDDRGYRQNEVSLGLIYDF